MSLALPAIADLHDAALTAALQHKIDRKTVPYGALGRLAAGWRAGGRVFEQLRGARNGDENA